MSRRSTISTSKCRSFCSRCPQFGGPAGEPCAAPINGGNSNIYGGELELNYNIGGFSLDGSYSHQHFEFTYVDPNTGITLGDLYPGFQDSKWSLGAQYQLRLPNAASITPRLDYSYSSGYFTNANNDPESWLPGYHLLNGRVTYKPDDGNWRCLRGGLQSGEWHLVHAALRPDDARGDEVRHSLGAAHRVDRVQEELRAANLMTTKGFGERRF